MSATYIHTKRKPGLARLIVRGLGGLYFVALGLAIVYLWLFTQDRYVCSAEFKISRQDNVGMEMGMGMVQLALPGLSDSGSMDSQITIGFIDSADLLLELEREFKLIAHYSAPQTDLVFRLKPDSSLEDRLAYYRNRISAHFDKDTGMTVVSVDTFDPKLAERITAELLKKSEAFVNTINRNIAEQQLGFVRSEVERTEKQVQEINVELLALQNAHNFITPDEAITANIKAVEGMRLQHLQAEAELSGLLRDSPNSPRIETLRSRIRSLNELMDVESAKLSGPEKNRLNQLLVQFKQLQMKLDFAIRLRSGAEILLEKNRTDAIARSRFFTVIQHPFVPEEAAIPRRPYVTVTLIVLGLFAFWILSAISRSLFER